MQERKVIDGGRVIWAAVTSWLLAWMLAQMIDGVWGGVEPGVPGLIWLIGGAVLFPSRWLASPKQPNVRWLIILSALVVLLSITVGFLCRYLSHMRFLWSSLLGAWLTAVVVIVTLFHYVRVRTVNKHNTWAAFFSWPVSASLGSCCLFSIFILHFFAYDHNWTRILVYGLAVLCIGGLAFSRHYIRQIHLPKSIRNSHSEVAVGKKSW